MLPAACLLVALVGEAVSKVANGRPLDGLAGATSVGGALVYARRLALLARSRAIR